MEETPLEVTTKYVHDVLWPASKEDVLQAVENNGAPDDVLETIRGIDKDTFTGPNDVHNAIWVDA